MFMGTNGAAGASEGTLDLESLSSSCGAQVVRHQMHLTVCV